MCAAPLPKADPGTGKVSETTSAPQTQRFMIPHGERETDGKKCQTIFYNLLAPQRSDLNADTSALYVREVMQTQRCDQFHDLSDLRAGYVSYIGAESMQNILDFKATDVDREKTASAAFHYVTWDHIRFKKALTWPNWIYYHTVDKAERTFAFVGIAAASISGWKVGAKTMKALRQRFAKPGSAPSNNINTPK